MANPSVSQTALARAWSVYLLMNKGVQKDDERRALVQRYIEGRWRAGVRDVESLAVLALQRLKEWDVAGPPFSE